MQKKVLPPQQTDFMFQKTGARTDGITQYVDDINTRGEWFIRQEDPEGIDDD